LVSAIIPARDEEATIARVVSSLDAQPEIGEIIVVNDQSTDSTRAVLEEMAVRLPKLKVLDTHELPAGWVGKNYAATVGAAAASGDWLLFTDADTFHLPGSTRHALADAAEHGAALVSYSPEQELRTFAERALIPLVYWRLSRKYSFERVNDPVLPDAAANGQFLLIRRDAYDAVGGHKAVRNRVLEDVWLARRVKHADYRIYFDSGKGVVRTRMYSTFRAMWEGWTKNLYSLMGGTLADVVGELYDLIRWAGAVLVILGILPRIQARWLFLLLGATLLMKPWMDYAAELWRNRSPFRLILYYVPGVCLYVPALIVSAWKNAHGTVVWKGRQYPAEMP
jgi:cellulose synthase/poly-beta-1,6-N-acetylglucosamine synthase-like glycosyltransferase